jgi:hypothetical protein
LRATFKLIALVSLAVLVAGCGKTVEWQEEVALATGERLWLTRRVSYERYGDNPLALGLSGWRVEREEMSFVWGGKPYTYAYGKVPAPMVLFIEPSTAAPAVIVPLPHRECRVPHFRQWVAAGGDWQERPLSPAAHGLHKNLMRHRPGTPEEAQARYSAEQVAQLDSRFRKLIALTVTPDFLPPDCRARTRRVPAASAPR